MTMAQPAVQLENLFKRYGAAIPANGLSLEIEKEAFFTMLGPSGSGKSTILRMIAGLETPDQGVVRIEGRDMTQTPPWDRNLGMVFQNYAVFPHLDVAGNVAYGLRRFKHGKDANAQRVEELLSLVGLTGFETRNVNQLSGGELQRVAIARALAPSPSILLLDEPLSALDERIRREMQQELRKIHARTGTTFIYVTHDQEEALNMSDRIAVLNAGRCVQCDTPRKIFNRPLTPFVADFFRGCNVVRAQFNQQDGRGHLSLNGQTVPIDPADRGVGSGHVAIRGENIRLHLTARENCLRLSAKVENVSYRGQYCCYLLRLADQQSVNATVAADKEFEVGSDIEIEISADDIVILEADKAM